MPTTRREVLVQIAMTPLAAQQPGHPAHTSTAKPAAGPYRRRVFNEQEFQTLGLLADLILPPDDKSGGGKAAGTAEFLDVMASGDPRLAAEFTGGLAWLDRTMQARHGKTFRECTADQQKQILDQIAWRARATAELAPGVRFFALMRAWTVDAFYSSPEGVKDLGYVGNTAVAEFQGCGEAVAQELLKRSPV
jgi:hypothetical protein